MSFKNKAPFCLILKPPSPSGNIVGHTTGN